MRFDLKLPWTNLNYDIYCQNSCLNIPDKNDGNWDITYPEIKEWLTNTKIIMHCQDFLNIENGRCRELEMIERHFGDNAFRVCCVIWNLNLNKVYSGPMQLIHFPTHSYDLIVDIRKTYDDWRFIFESSRSHIWQSLNGLPKRHRRLVYDYLSCFDSGIMSLGNEIPLKSNPYSEYKNCDNVTNWKNLLSIYADCDLNIVTESIYYSESGIITEKTLMSFLSLQIPIIIGHKGIVQECRDLGFDMFVDIVDISYDTADDESRWKMALDLNHSLLIKGIDRTALTERLIRNQEHVLAWPEKMINSYLQKCYEIHNSRANL